MADFLGVPGQTRVGWSEYDRPPVNAFHWEMLREVPEALERHLTDPAVRVVVIGSALDAHFSVGADLRVFAEMDDGGMRRWVDVCHDLVRRMRASPKPLLAAVHGTAVGGGLEMVLHCDVQIGRASSR